MSFSDFRGLAEVQQKYNIFYQEKNFLNAKATDISASFVQDFDLFIENVDAFSSEAARCELLISPLLREVYKQYITKYAFWIQKPMNYDAELCGTPDYIFSGRSPLGKTVFEKPIVIIVEAKKNDFEQGWGQCLAELIAAQKINQDEINPVYGIVTDGNLWQFGRLIQQTFTKDRDNFTIDNLPKLYGGLHALMEMISLEKSESTISTQ